MLNFTVLPYSRRQVFEDLSVVQLKVDMRVGDQLVTAGSRGTVVFTYRDGRAYEVEFFEPVPAVLTVAADDLTQ